MLMIFIVLALLSLGTRSRWFTVTRMPKTYSFTNNPKTTVHANGRLLPTWLHRKVVLARKSLGILMMTPIPVSSNKKQQFPVIIGSILDALPCEFELPTATDVEWLLFSYT